MKQEECVASADERAEVVGGPSEYRSGDAQKSTEDPSLPMQIMPSDPQHLALPYHLCRFDSLNHRPRRCPRPRSLHSAQAALDVAVIRFDTVIAITTGPLPAMSAYVTLGLQFPDRGRIAPQSISGKDVWRPIIAVGQWPSEE